MGKTKDDMAGDDAEQQGREGKGNREGAEAGGTTQGGSNGQGH